MSYNEMRAKVAELKLEVADTKKKTLIDALTANQEPAKTETRGRKVNPNSARQLKLKAIAERKANGEVIKRGRPVDPNSASAKKRAEREARIGRTLARVRPVPRCRSLRNRQRCGRLIASDRSSRPPGYDPDWG